MPIAWRRSIRQTGSSGPPNPFRYLTDAIQATLESVVNGAVAVVAFPFVVAGKAAGAVKRGGVTGVTAVALCLGLVAALVTSDSGVLHAICMRETLRALLYFYCCIFLPCFGCLLRNVSGLGRGFKLQKAGFFPGELATGNLCGWLFGVRHLYTPDG